MPLSSQFDYYRGHHQPDTSEDEIRFHELDKGMPEFYKRPSDYLWDVDTHYGKVEAKQSALRARGNPEADVRIYRAVPHGVTTINPGDWVTTSHQYAKQHGMHESDPEQDMPVISAITKAKHITFGGNDAYEFGYAGTEQLPHDPR